MFLFIYLLLVESTAQKAEYGGGGQTLLMKKLLCVCVCVCVIYLHDQKPIARQVLLQHSKLMDRHLKGNRTAVWEILS